MLEVLPDWVLEACENPDDVTEATSFLLAYCSDKGYTEVVTPVLATPTGAWTVTETVAGTTVTHTVYVSAGASVNPLPMSYWDKRSPAIILPVAVTWVLLASL
jgi:hypothetical protein